MNQSLFKAKNIILIISLAILALFIARGIGEGMRIVYWKSAFSTGIVIIIISQIIKMLFKKSEPLHDVAFVVTTYLQFMALLSVFSAFGVIASYGAAWGNTLANGKIMSDMDLFFGFNWLLMNKWLIHYPLLVSILTFFYNSISFLPFLLIALLIVDKRVDAAWDFFIFMVITAAVTNVIFYLYPCIGPVYSNQHNAVSNLSYIDSLKVAFNKAGIFTFGLHSIDGVNLIKDSKGYYYMTGIVAFPSYHAILAAGTAYFSKYLKLNLFTIIFVFFGIAMTISAIPIGDHYLTDILGGLIVAGFGIWAIQKNNNGFAKSLADKRNS